MADLNPASLPRKALGLRAALVLGGLVVTTDAAQDPYKREPPVDRTTPILERMTPAQREHAKLHASHERTGTRLLDEKLSLSTTSQWASGGSGNPMAEVLRSLSCEADAVFSGFVAKAESFPAENGLVLFTDYEVAVGDVFSTRDGAVLLSASTTVVTQVGGQMEIEGSTISAELAGYPYLKAGHEYVFFVKYLPTSKAYHLTRPGKVWEVAGGRVKALAPSEVNDADVYRSGADLNVVVGHLRSVRCGQ